MSNIKKFEPIDLLPDVAVGIKLPFTGKNGNLFDLYTNTESPSFTVIGIRSPVIVNIPGPTFNSSNSGSLLFDGTNDYVTFGNQNLGIDLTNKSFCVGARIRQTC